MTRQTKSPMEKLIKRYKTRQTNLKEKRTKLIGEYESELEIIDAELTDIAEILSRLEAKK